LGCTERARVAGTELVAEVARTGLVVEVGTGLVAVVGTELVAVVGTELVAAAGTELVVGTAGEHTAPVGTVVEQHLEVVERTGLVAVGT